MKETESISKKTWITYAVSGLVIFIVVLFAIFQPSSDGTSTNLKKEALAIWGSEIDLSNSLFPEEDHPIVLEQIEEVYNDIQALDQITVEHVVELARQADRIRDYEKALALYELARLQDPEDKYFLVDYGKVYLELQQWENARKIFEPMRIDYPVYDAYLGLASAYKNIDGTPDYVIDDIYEESLQRHRFRYEVTQAYVKWLEATDREDQTIPYYNILQNASPQELLEKRIEELEQKYPNAPREL
jgi:tetratricopeptide (TPR) repeat protein